MAALEYLTANGLIAYPFKAGGPVQIQNSNPIQDDWFYDILFVSFDDSLRGVYLSKITKQSSGQIDLIFKNIETGEELSDPVAIPSSEVVVHLGNSEKPFFGVSTGKYAIKLILGPGLVGKGPFEQTYTNQEAELANGAFVPKAPHLSSLDFSKHHAPLPDGTKVSSVHTFYPPDVPYATLRSNLKYQKEGNTAIGLLVGRGFGTGLYDPCPHGDIEDVLTINNTQSGPDGEVFLKGSECYSISNLNSDDYNNFIDEFGAEVFNEYEGLLNNDNNPSLETGYPNYHALSFRNFCSPKCAPENMNAFAYYLNRVSDGAAELARIATNTVITSGICRVAGDMLTAISFDNDPSTCSWVSIPAGYNLAFEKGYHEGKKVTLTYDGATKKDFIIKEWISASQVRLDSEPPPADIRPLEFVVHDLGVLSTVNCAVEKYNMASEENLNPYFIVKYTTTEAYNMLGVYSTFLALTIGVFNPSTAPINFYVDFEATGPLVKQGQTKVRYASYVDEGVASGTLECKGYAFVEVVYYIQCSQTGGGIVVNVYDDTNTGDIKQIGDAYSLVNINSTGCPGSNEEEQLVSVLQGQTLDTHVTKPEGHVYVASSGNTPSWLKVDDQYSQTQVRLYSEGPITSETSFNYYFSMMFSDGTVRLKAPIRLQYVAAPVITYPTETATETNKIIISDASYTVSNPVFKIVASNMGVVMAAGGGYSYSCSPVPEGLIFSGNVIDNNGTVNPYAGYLYGTYTGPQVDDYVLTITATNPAGSSTQQVHLKLGYTDMPVLDFYDPAVGSSVMITSQDTATTSQPIIKYSVLNGPIVWYDTNITDIPGLLFDPASLTIYGAVRESASSVYDLNLTVQTRKGWSNQKTSRIYYFKYNKPTVTSPSFGQIFDIGLDEQIDIPIICTAPYEAIPGESVTPSGVFNTFSLINPPANVLINSSTGRIYNTIASSLMPQRLNSSGSPETYSKRFPLEILISNPAGSTTTTVYLNVTRYEGPAVYSFTPAGGRSGDTITITGTNFYNVSAVKFGQLAASSFTVISSTKIAAVAPTGVTAGVISVETLQGIATSTNTFSIITEAPSITSGTSASVDANATFLYAITATNSPTSFNATSLPAGLSINTTTGAITGKVATGGVYNITISATNSVGTSTATLELSVGAVPTITSELTGSASVGATFSYTITATNSPASFNATNIPNGLTINTLTGVISGTPIAAGTYNVGLSAKNSTGTATALLVLTVGAAAPIINSQLTTTVKVQQTLSYRITATNSPTSFGATGLPTGLTVNTSNGIISGTPRTIGVYNIAITATNSAGTATATLIMTVDEMVPTITSALSASTNAGQSFSYTITATNSPTSFNALNLPAGLSIDTSSGIISGTPTVAGISNIALRATNSAGTGTATLALTINSVTPVISSSLSATATAGASFSYTITATNSPTSFSAVNLPSGLSINTSTGVISGTPTQGGVYSITIRASNSVATGSAILSLNVRNISPVITSALTASSTVGTNFTYTIAATNSPTAFNATNLPGGLSVNTSTGVISGTPTTPGTTEVTISATNQSGTGSAKLVITVRAQIPVIVSSLTSTAFKDTPFTYTIGATNSPASFGSSTLPTGLSLNTSTGVISGTPTVSGNFSITIRATNSAGTGSATLALSISAIPVITSTLAVSIATNTSFTYAIRAQNNPTSYNAINLPTGLSINSSTGVISGSVATKGTYQITIKALNAAGEDSKTLVLSVVAPPVITSELSREVAINASFNYSITADNSPTAFSVSGLPTGLTLDTTTGVITGFPAVSGTFNVTLTAINMAGTDSKVLVLKVVGVPVINSALTATANKDSSFVYSITALNEPTSFNATSLPTGLSINTTTGDITGIPTQAGTYSVQISATNLAGTDTKALDLTVAAIPAITSSLAEALMVDQIFYYNIAATNSPTSFSASNYPSNFSFDPATGYLAGQVRNAGTFDISIGAINQYGTGRGVLVLTVTAETRPVTDPPVITSPLTAAIGVNTAFFYRIVATNTPSLFQAVNLPTGLSISSSTGVISGVISSTGTYSISITASNAMGADTKTLVLTVVAPPVITSATQLTVDDDAYLEYTITATNSPTSYQAINLTTGLTLNASTGLISGTVTTPGTYGIWLKAINAAGVSTKQLTLTVRPLLPVITSALSATATADSPFTYTITATREPTSYSAIGLPAGLTLNTTTGVISGSPAAAGVKNITIKATNAAGTTSETLVLTINVTAPVITSALTASFDITDVVSYQITATKYPTSFGATNLPGGLTINTTTGIISGTPTASGTYNVSISATNINSTTTATLVLTIRSGEPSITSELTSSINSGEYLNYYISATKYPTSYNAVGLPDGLTINQDYGYISGYVTALAGTYNVLLSATNAQGTGYATLVITVTYNPTVSGFSTWGDTYGATITVSGNNFIGATSVKFNGLEAASFNVVSATSISAVIPINATTGPISVTVGGITASSSYSFYINPSAPSISSFTPGGGDYGTTVTITGSRFYYITSVKFNSIEAASFTVVNSTTITAVAPSSGDITGQLSVTGAGGSGSSGYYGTFYGKPTITSVSPSPAYPGQTIEINGSNFYNASVSFITSAGTASTWLRSNTGSKITVDVPSASSLGVNFSTGAVTCTISVSGTGGTATVTNFTINPPMPTLHISSSIYYYSQAVGNTIQLYGSNFLFVQSVLFTGGASGQITSRDDSNLSVVIPSGALSGPVTLVTNYYTVTSPESVYIGTCTFTAVSSLYGDVGSTIVLTGTNLDQVDQVLFDSTSTRTFTVSTDKTQLTVTIPQYAGIGKITLYLKPSSMPALQSSKIFTPIYSGPSGSITASAISPSSGAVGSYVGITLNTRAACEDVYRAFFGGGGVMYRGNTFPPGTTSDYMYITTNANNLPVLWVKVPGAALTGNITLQTYNYGTCATPTSFTVT